MNMSVAIRQILISICNTKTAAIKLILYNAGKDFKHMQH
jgi:hypothetical protein